MLPLVLPAPSYYHSRPRTTGVRQTLRSRTARKSGFVRAWSPAQTKRYFSSYAWDALDRLHTKGYISDPKSKAKSVVLSAEGVKRARELFEQHFGRKR